VGRRWLSLVLVKYLLCDNVVVAAVVVVLEVDSGCVLAKSHRLSLWVKINAVI